VKELIGAVVQDGDTFAYVCRMNVLDQPARPNTPFQALCRWTSNDWDNPEDAEARGRAHEIEHETGEPMSEMADSEEFQRQIETRRLAAEAAAAPITPESDDGAEG
jgi:hypothetical protein